MPQLAFVMSPGQNWYVRELADTLRYELDQQGVPSALHLGGFPQAGAETIYVLVAPHEYVALEGDSALPDVETLRRTIFLCTQPPSALSLDDDAEPFRHAGAVFDIDPRSVALFRHAGIEARHLRPGYSKCRDAFDPQAERSIDVMFLGIHSFRRTKELSRCAQVLARHNCLLQVADDSDPNPGGSTSFLAEGKWDLLTRTKILLNVHRGEDSYLEWLRVLDAIHSGSVVVTEHSSGLAPLVEGEHLLVAGAESLPYVLDAALRDPERLQRIRTAAYERIRSLLPFALSVSVFRAAAVELVGRSASQNASLGRRGAAQPRDSPAVALQESPEGRVVARGLKAIRVEMAMHRRDIARLEKITRSGDATPSGTRLVHRTPVWSAHRVPRVSVLTALANDEKTVRATLDSLARASFAELELVVVDDGSSDESCDCARKWMSTHPSIPALLAAQEVTRGRGAARNTALAFAQAPYCLVLDGGDEVYPRCLDVLYGTLEGLAGATFAYPILEVTGMADALTFAGGDYLLNQLGWETGRLLLGTQVGCLAMIRTDRLRALAGFAEEIELYGWEDYDLWCRVADRGWRGQLVPQILGRYRASLARAALFSDVPPTMALVDRAPRLFAGPVANALAERD